MANPFDIFDEPEERKREQRANPFDRFDPPSSKPRRPGNAKRIDSHHRDFDGSNIPGYNPETGIVEDVSTAEAAAHGFADIGSWSAGDELAATLGRWLTGEDRDKVLRQMRQRQQDAWDQHPYAYVAGAVPAAIGSGVALARGGLSMAGNALARGAPLRSVAAGSAVDIGAAGAVGGFNSGQGLEDRLYRAGVGGIGGAAAGAGLPYATAGISAMASPFVAGLLSHFQPDKYANRSLNTMLQRSGMTADDVASTMRQAADDGQPMFTVADATGNAGQRLLSTVTRSPNDARQGVTEFLDARQAGQGRRIATALDDAFGSAEGTALQREAAERAARRTAGNANYGAARQAAGAVDTGPAIKAIDDVIQPGLTPLIGPGAVDNGVYATLGRMRGLLTNGRTQVSDFDRAFMAKQEMDKALEQGGVVASMLKPARNALDDALAASSKPYAAARDAYRTQSQAIAAIDTGRQAARRGRPEDTIPAFRSLPEGAQPGFRTGYADPLIESAQGAPVGVNKARPLISDATAAEFPAFAVPGRGDQLGRRLAREQRMFETRNHALGNSRTADNLADMSDNGQFDILANLLLGRPLAAVAQAGGRLVNNARGMPASVRGRVGRALVETNPDRASQAFNRAVQTGNRDRLRKALMQAIMGNLVGTGAGRATP